MKPILASLALSLLCLSLHSGCATRAMKGTPFYTGEWEQRTGPVEDRISFWPFVYYREPALSVLWPLYEQSPDHIALRPLYSVHGRENNQHVHRVLWPLGQFDTVKRENRFFPFFWDDDSFVAFPVYWRFGEPFGGERGTHSLFPLWIYSRNRPREESTLHLAWPLARFERGPDLSRNRIIPLFVHQSLPDGTRSFRSLPFGNEVRPTQNEHLQWLLPFYIRKSSPDETYFYSLPYSWRTRGDDTARYAMGFLWSRQERPDESVHWLFPLYYQRQTDSSSSWITPLGAWRRNDDGSNRILTPLWVQSEDGQGRSLKMVPPLLSWRSETPERVNWTLLGALARFSSGENPDPDYIFPLYYRNPESNALLTPAYARWTRDNGEKIRAVPPLLSWRSETPERVNWTLLGALARFSSGENPDPDYIFPLYHRNQNNGTLLTPLYYRNQSTGTLLTPFYQRGGNAEQGIRWSAVAPLFLQRHSETSSAWVTPLGGITRHDNDTGRTITPLYLRINDRPGHTLHAIPPLLSWRSETPERVNWNLFGALARFSGGENPDPDYLFPLYYRNPESNALITPAYARWTRDNDEKIRAVPPLFSWRSETPERVNWNLLGPLARFSTGENPDPDYLFPFYYRNPRTNALITPAYARWTRDNDEKIRAIPPLLSWRSETPERVNWNLLGPLARFSGGENPDPDYLFPLYYRNPRTNALITPAYARWTRDNGDKIHAIPPLLSWRAEKPDGTRTGNVALGLYHQSASSDGELEHRHLLPLFYHRPGHQFYTPLFGRNNHASYWLTPLVGTHRNSADGGWIFPFFNWRQDPETGHHDSSFLVWGYHRTSPLRSETRWFPLFHHRTRQAPTSEQPHHIPDFHQIRTQEDLLSLLILFRRSREVTEYGPRSAPQVEGKRYARLTETHNRLFPLWRFNRKEFGREEGPELAEGNILWRLYDKREEHGTPDEPHEYVRHRILWRLWHYERLDGDVSVDSFPFITYDRKTDGFRRVSFMWRVFRHTRTPEGGTDLDILFLPLRRAER